MIFFDQFFLIVVMESKWQVFETEDEQPEDLPVIHSKPVSEDIDISEPSVEHSFEVFAGKRFSTSSSRQRRPELTPESPFERFNRLRIELDELSNDLGLCDESDGNAAYIQLANGVKSLQTTLSTLETHQHLGGKSVTTGSVAASEELMQAIQPSMHSEQNASVKYELFFSAQVQGEIAKVNAMQLEERVTRLENIVGVDFKQELHTPLAVSVAELEKRIAQLDDMKLSSMSQKFKTLANDPNFKVGDDSIELVRKLENCESIAQNVPVLIDRLEALQDVHRNNALFHVRMSNVEKMQNDILKAAELDRQLLENLKKSLAENVETIQRNLSKR